MNKFHVPPLVALAASISALSHKDTRHAGPDDANYKLSIDDETDPTSGAGGTEQQVKTDPSEANANSNVITSVAGGGEQMQAQAENASQVGGQALEAKKDDTGNDAGQVKAIGDPPDNQAQQV